MTQLSFSSATNIKQQKIYCYINRCHQIIVAKITGLKGKNWQRIVFPAEKLLFVADDKCQIEVYRSNNKEIIQEAINCSNLAVVQQQESV